ncbi:MAG: hypothetical protein IJF53_03055 [Clostridia bacterium]|nr:hypothetical protein [Clostridia bacterium]
MDNSKKAHILLEEKWDDIKQNSWKCKAQKNYEVRYYNLMRRYAEDIYTNIDNLSGVMDRCTDLAKRLTGLSCDDGNDIS